MVGQSKIGKYGNGQKVVWRCRKMRSHVLSGISKWSIRRLARHGGLIQISLNLQMNVGIAAGNMHEETDTNSRIQDSSTETNLGMVEKHAENAGGWLINDAESNDEDIPVYEKYLLAKVEGQEQYDKIRADNHLEIFERFNWHYYFRCNHEGCPFRASYSLKERIFHGYANHNH